MKANYSIVFVSDMFASTAFSHDFPGSEIVTYMDPDGLRFGVSEE